MNELQDLKRDCRVLESTLRSYVDYFCRETNHYRGYSNHPVVPKNKGKKNHDYHEFVPSNNTTHVIRCLYSIQEYLIKQRDQSSWHALKFLDAGCGVGNIMLLAEAVGFRVKGVEYDTKTWRLGNKLVKNNQNKPKIIKGDIITFRGYKNYDVIYFYVPIQNYERMQCFVTNLKNRMKVGAVVIVYNYSVENIKDDKRFKELIKFRTDWLSVLQKIKK